MQIGSVSLAGRLVLAPMAGVTDRAFRQVCREHGAALTVTEMVSTKALCYQDKKTPALLALGEGEHPAAAQIFGHEPETMAEGARIARAVSGCDMIDINMGCPAPKIAGNGDGSALMRDPALAARVIEAVACAVDVPVTVKFRKGWDEQSQNYVEFARMAEQAGAAALAVHGRTRAQQYSGAADWEAIRAVKQAVSIPVAANGDVAEPEDVLRILDATGADMVMIGRGALGDPWIFERANALLATGVCPPLPPFAERIDTAVRQIELAAAYKGERVAMLEARRHVNCYLKRQSGLKAFKTRICALERLEELYHLAEELKQTVQDG
ncbi:MAG: tRNA dihydrouridine synthase DusB [Agathobaculum desmolans]|uniref:tRNA dihydrouridine synthase DusB n=1 Tax=Agathobaculum desmolans TaxID=39484 RepID=UPI003995F66C